LIIAGAPEQPFDWHIFSSVTFFVASQQVSQRLRKKKESSEVAFAALGVL
jgi:hypothetical protein